MSNGDLVCNLESKEEFLPDEVHTLVRPDDKAALNYDPMCERTAATDRFQHLQMHRQSLSDFLT